MPINVGFGVKICFTSLPLAQIGLKLLPGAPNGEDGGDAYESHCVLRESEPLRQGVPIGPARKSDYEKWGRGEGRSTK